MAGRAEDRVFDVGEGGGAEGYGGDICGCCGGLFDGVGGGEGWRWDCGGDGICDEVIRKLEEISM